MTVYGDQVVSLVVLGHHVARRVHTERPASIVEGRGVVETLNLVEMVGEVLAYRVGNLHPNPNIHRHRGYGKLQPPDHRLKPGRPVPSGSGYDGLGLEPSAVCEDYSLGLAVLDDYVLDEGIHHYVALILQGVVHVVQDLPGGVGAYVPDPGGKDLYAHAGRTTDGVLDHRSLGFVVAGVRSVVDEYPVHRVYQLYECRLTDVLLQVSAKTCGDGQLSVGGGACSSPPRDHATGRAVYATVGFPGYDRAYPFLYDPPFVDYEDLFSCLHQLQSGKNPRRSRANYNGVVLHVFSPPLVIYILSLDYTS